jgi:hypothetical protein
VEESSVKVTIDTEQQELVLHDDGRRLPLYSTEAFEVLSALWLKVGWNEKYVYTFSWMGRPIIQLPDDLVRVQEVIYRLRPDVIVETGVAHGGSLIFYASLLRAMGLPASRVIGVDIEIRPHNRRAIEAHELFGAITLIEGNSVAPEVVSQVRAYVCPGDKCSCCWTPTTPMPTSAPNWRRTTSWCPRVHTSLQLMASCKI